jgi:dTDP-3-amino-3,4,6-trideoxy-alpha-D-glucose transaminase
VVPLVDLSRRLSALLPLLTAAVGDVARSGQVLLGPELVAFEREFAAFTGREHCVGVGSGASAIQLALLASGVGPGDEVIVPAFTAVPTAAAVATLGAVPVPVDVDRATGALDPDAARAALTARTVAVVPVHLYGRPAPLPDLGVPVIEDAAQAHGALVDGTRGVAACYSFYPTKNLGGIGDGGAVVTDDAAFAERVRRLRVHGQERGYVHVDVAMNSRMSEIESSWLRLALDVLPTGNARRRAIAARYAAAAPELQWHPDHPHHVRHLCVARTPARDDVRARLEAAGVQTGVHYPVAITRQPAYAHFVRDACPEAEAWAAECVSVPCFPELTDAEVDHVCDALAAVVPAVQG